MVIDRIWSLVKEFSEKFSKSCQRCRIVISAKNLGGNKLSKVFNLVFLGIGWRKRPSPGQSQLAYVNAKLWHNSPLGL